MNAHQESPSNQDPRLAYIPGVEAEIFVEPSAEQWFWVQHASWLLSPKQNQPHPLSRWYTIMTVVPSTNLTNLSLQYQSYLNDIFHTTWIARLGHALAMPCIVICLSLIFYSYCGLWVALAFHIGMTAWWLLWAALERDWIWGISLTALSAGIWSASLFLHAHQVSPWLPLLVFALIQTLSHVPEPLPPRVTRSARWVPLKDYLLNGTIAQRLRHLGHVSMQIIYGVIDETLASPRLVCVIVLELLWLCGHRSEQRKQWKQLSHKAIASGNPALDYIGIGGGTTLRPSSTDSR